VSKDSPEGISPSEERDLLTHAQVEQLRAQGRAVTFLDYVRKNLRSPMILPSTQSDKYTRSTTLQIGGGGELETVTQIVAYSPPASPAVDSWHKRLAATRTAQTTFKYLCKAVGLNEAQRIFREIAGARQKIDTANCTLLSEYISDPDRLARFVSQLSKTRSEFHRHIYGRAPTGIEDQLKRLLGKRPPKKASSYLRELTKEATEVHRQTKRRPGPPKRK
jgi:hypothetical protein